MSEWVRTPAKTAQATRFVVVIIENVQEVHYEGGEENEQTFSCLVSLLIGNCDSHPSSFGFSEICFDIVET